MASTHRSGTRPYKLQRVSERRALRFLSLAFLLLQLTGCALGRAAHPDVAPVMADTGAMTPGSTSQPQASSAVEPTETWIPTVTPRGPQAIETPVPELMVTVAAVEAEMQELRGLYQTDPLTPTLLTSAEMAALVAQEFEEEYTPEEVDADLKVLIAFDFVPPGFDLYQTLVDLYSSEVIGLYDSDLNSFYLVSEGGLGLLERVTLAHEIVHGLQDRNHGLDDFYDETMSDDEILARAALVEGDASLSMTQYLLAHSAEITSGDLAELSEAGGEASSETLSQTPPILRETLLFPYIQGHSFVTELQRNGWRSVDAAFSSPPQSTEQILHPEKYLTRDEPQLIALPPLTDTLGSGWALVEVETLGEFQTSLYLAQQLESEKAALAAQGWNGDRYAVYANGGQLLMVLWSAWDGVADRKEFVDAYRLYADNKYASTASRTEAATLWWEAGSQTAVLAWRDQQSLVVLGPNHDTVSQALAAVGF